MSVTVAAADNMLAQPALNVNDGVITGNPIITTLGLREIQLTMTTLTGSIVSKVQYLVRAPDARLVLLQNSFQTYNMSLMTASQLPLLNGWLTATESQRINAMSTAWLRLTKLGYFVRWPRDPDAQNYLNWFDLRNEIIIPRLWTVMTTQRWLTYYPELFRQSMRNAQVVEADVILTQNPLLVKRIDGILTEKIGAVHRHISWRHPDRHGRFQAGAGLYRRLRRLQILDREKLMFIPNTTGLWTPLIGTNKFGAPIYAAQSVTVGCGVVELDVTVKKTAIRTDASASRSNIDEDVVTAKILFPATVAIGKEDKFSIVGRFMRVMMVEPRWGIDGVIDHYECDFEEWEA